MRILILQDLPERVLPTEKFSIARGIERAFLRAGFDVYAVDTNTINNYEIEHLFKLFDTLIVTQNYSLEKIKYVDTFNGLKIFWSIDSHKDFENHAKFVLENKFDIALVSSLNYVDQFKSKNINAFWFPNCYPSDLIKPTSFKNRPVQIGFCGSKSNRGEWLSKLSCDFNFHLAINVLAEDMVKTLYSYGICWNRNEADDINFRTFEAMGAGCLMLTNETSGSRSLFNRLSIKLYFDYQDCIDKIKYFNNNESDRLKVAISGYNEVRKNHSYDARVADLIQIIETGENRI
jgi:spore maturation protein CgeB